MLGPDGNEFKTLENRAIRKSKKIDSGITQKSRNSVIAYTVPELGPRIRISALESERQYE